MLAVIDHCKEVEVQCGCMVERRVDEGERAPGNGDGGDCACGHIGICSIHDV